MRGGRLVWEVDGADWPHRDASRFVAAGGFRWHVQVMGKGPVALLLHGTGAATHSWRGLAPLLARRFTVVAPDLPGHAFTDVPPADGLSLPGMAAGVRALLAALDVAPALAVGHSAGAAILARMCLDGALDLRLLVGLNAALLPLRGAAGFLFAPLAKLLVLNPLVPSLFAWSASRGDGVERLLQGTGSTPRQEDVAFYRRLVASSHHVSAVLRMMAAWDLDPLERDLPRLQTPLALVVGEADRTIPPREARRLRILRPDFRLVPLPGLGHLAHEEDPRRLAAVVLQLWRDARTG